MGIPDRGDSGPWGFRVHTCLVWSLVTAKKSCDLQLFGKHVGSLIAKLLKLSNFAFELLTELYSAI